MVWPKRPEAAQFACSGCPNDLYFNLLCLLTFTTASHPSHPFSPLSLTPHFVCDAQNINIICELPRPMNEQKPYVQRV